MDGNTNTNLTYAQKLDEQISESIKAWWTGLSKEEILEYLAGQPSVTADTLRDMISNMNSVLAFDVRFSSNALEAAVDFHTH